MDFFLLFLIISQTGFSYFLFTKIKQLQKEKESNPGDLVLPKLKEMPKIENIDPDSKLLRDVIESAKLEGWESEIQEEPTGVYRSIMLGSNSSFRSWEIIIWNPTKTITIRTILRLYSDDVYVGYFNVGGVSYNCRENTLQKYLVVEYLWSLILQQNEKEYQSTWSSYIKSKEKIENCLTTLKRDRQLKKLFDKDLDDSK